MSTYNLADLKCAICGGEQKRVIITSTCEFGFPDLDLRPPELKRSTMMFWIQKCPYCAYTAPDVSIYQENDSSYLDTDEYRNCEGLSTDNEQCKKYYQFYLLARNRRNHIEQLAGLLYAVWTCDDENNNSLATELRKKAADILMKVEWNTVKQAEEMLLLRADLLRRSGQFHKLIEEYHGKTFENENLRKILKFEVLLAKEKDDSCYTVEQALKTVNAS